MSIENTPINLALNAVDHMSHSPHSNFARHVAPRLTNLVVTVPLQALVIAEDILTLPVQACFVGINLATKVFSCLTGSKALHDLHKRLPSFIDMIRTITNIVVNSISALLTITLGVISPSTNFKLHCATTMAVDIRAKRLLEEQFQREQNMLIQQALLLDKIDQEQRAADANGNTKEDTSKTTPAATATTQTATAQDKVEKTAPKTAPTVEIVEDADDIDADDNDIYEDDNGIDEDYNDIDDDSAEFVEAQTTPDTTEHTN